MGRRQGVRPLSPTERRELPYGKDTARGPLAGFMRLTPDSRAPAKADPSARAGVGVVVVVVVMVGVVLLLLLWWWLLLLMLLLLVPLLSLFFVVVVVVVAVVVVVFLVWCY